MFWSGWFGANEGARKESRLADFCPVVIAKKLVFLLYCGAFDAEIEGAFCLPVTLDRQNWRALCRKIKYICRHGEI